MQASTGKNNDERSGDIGTLYFCGGMDGLMDTRKTRICTDPFYSRKVY